MAHKRITRDELDQLCESQALEFKRSLSSRTEAMKDLNGMINTDAAVGTVIFGVAPEGTPVGVEGNMDRQQQSLVQHIHGKFDPDIQINIELLECEGHPLLSVRGTRLDEVAYHEYDGRAFIREGSSTRQLKRTEKENLVRRREGPNNTYVPLGEVLREGARKSLTEVRDRSGTVTTVQVWCGIGDANRQRVCRDLVTLLTDAGFKTEGPTPVMTPSQESLPPLSLVARSTDTQAADDIAAALLAHIECDIDRREWDKMPDGNMQVWVYGVPAFRPTGGVVL